MKIPEVVIKNVKKYFTGKEVIVQKPKSIYTRTIGEDRRCLAYYGGGIAHPVAEVVVKDKTQNLDIVYHIAYMPEIVKEFPRIERIEGWAYNEWTFHYNKKTVRDKYLESLVRNSIFYDGTVTGGLFLHLGKGYFLLYYLQGID